MGKKFSPGASSPEEKNTQEKAFTEVFEKHSDELFRHCLMRLSDRERALEITQECFLRAWDYLARGEEVREYRPFLYRILHNLIVDEYRRHKAQSLDALLADEETAVYVEGTFLRDESNAFEQAVLRFEAADALRAIEQLPVSYRDVLLLRYMESLSPKEIAEITHESENVISVRIHRGLRKVRDILESPLV